MRISTVKKILLGLTAFSLFATPAQASEITDRDGNPLIDPDQQIHNLYAQELDGNTARSTYDKFSLDENQIANMHFNVEGGNVFATDLINVVNSRIDINGTVNAIRNGAIDGNLFFLSPEGIAVGKSGVINAGAFTAQSEGGSVEINGTINARNNISLIGQSITVNGAALNSNTAIDFTTLVNAGSTVNDIANLKMTVDPNGTGDIIIRAESETTLDLTGAGIKPTAVNDITQTTINNSTLSATGDLTVETKAARNFTVTPASDGNVNLQAIMINAGVIDLDSAYSQKLIKESGYEAPTSTGAVSTDIADSTLTAGGTVKINTLEQNDATLVNGTQSTVGATVLAVNHNTKTVLATSTVSGKSVEIGAAQAGTINSTVNEVGGGIAELGIGYNSVKCGGETLVNLRGSNVTASDGDINIRAEDNLAVELSNAAAPTTPVGTPSTVGKSINNSSICVLLESLSNSSDNLSATGELNINAVSASSANINVASAPITTATATDNSTASITVRNSDHSFKGNTINLATQYVPIAVANIPAGYQSSGRTQLSSTAELNGGASLDVSNGNTFDTATVNYTATSGSIDNINADAQLRSLNGADNIINTAAVNTNATTNVKIGNEIYNAGAAIIVESTSNIGRNALANGYSTNLSSGQDAAAINAADKVSASIGSGSTAEHKVGSLTVSAIDNGASNLKATGGTGSSSIASSSSIQNVSGSEVKASVGGKWTVDDAITVNATSNDNVVANVQQGYSDDGAAISASNSLGGSTVASVDKSAVLNATTVDVSARSNFNADNALDFNSNLNVNKKSAVDVGATVTTTGAQAYAASSNGNLVNKVCAIDTVSDGNAYVDANSNVAVDNQVRIAKDAALKAEDAVSIRANDVLNLESSAVGVNYSTAGAIITRTNNSIDRKNIVDVAGNIRANGIITVEAGAISDANPQIAINANTDSSNPRRNLSQLPADLQVSTYTLSENNSVSVDGTVHGSNDVNLRASEGNVNVRHSNRMRGFLTDAYYDNLLEIGDGNKINAITVNGRAQAGVSSDDININISGSVVPSTYNIAGTDNSGSLTVSANVDVDYDEGDMQYAKELTDRLNTLDDLIRQYTTGAQTDVSNAALAGYVAERERVMQKLRALGLVEQEGNNESVKDEGIDVRYVELGNLFANGGTLTLTADTVSGSGTLKAVGSANVNITNTSNAYLILNDIIRDSTGGYITLNGKTVSSNDDALASSLTVDSSAEKGAGAVTVLNNPNTSIVNVTATLDGSPSTYTPRSDLRLKGSIENFYGDISIVNRKGDIDIASEYVKDASGLLVVANTAEVIGKNVLIEANGTFSQGYVDGMLNISKSLDTIFQDQTQNSPAEARSHLNVDITDLDGDDEYVTTIADNVDGGTNDGRISGSNIYIAALDLNINGIIQSGFDSYIVDVNPNDISDNQYVGKSGAVYNATKGYYDYYVPLTYADGKLRAEDIETGGGQIYLSGQIASTGNGKIFAANGLANISVNNNSSIPIELGNLINNNRSGKITVVDTGNDTWQEFTPGQTRFINNYTDMLSRHYLDGMLYDTMQTTSNNLDSQNMYYQPAAGLRYSWTSGNEERTTNFYLDGRQALRPNYQRRRNRPRRVSFLE